MSLNVSGKKDLRERVLILHGFAACSLVMRPLQFWLNRQGFEANLWCYPSLRIQVPELARKLSLFLDSYDQEGKSYHIVAHSMGSIITRAALLHSNPTWLKRIVFLAPPIHGTPVARLTPGFMKGWFPPLTDMSDAENSFVNRLPKSLPVEAGVLSARFDVLVPMPNTIPWEGIAHRVVNGTHNSILASSNTARLVSCFLKQGQFPKN